MNKDIVYTASRIFTGTDMLHHHAIVVREGLIAEILPAVSLAEDTEIVDFGEAIIAPPFIDIQLYGAYGRLLSVYPDPLTVAEIYRYSKNGGAAYCFPTVATNSYEVIFACIDAIRNYWAQGGEGVPGLHVEGPWISRARKGAHREDLIFSPTPAQAKELLDYGKDVIRILTLAPEECSGEVLEMIRSRDILVSAGHSNLTYEAAMEAFDNGIDTATHLFNAMSPLNHRAPGLVGAIFSHPGVRASIIPDGHHVDFAAIRIAKKLMEDRLFVITDAVTETSEGFYQHKREGDKYVSGGILSGSALTMASALKNLTERVGISLPEALRMCSLYPARVCKLSDTAGMLKKDYPAKMVVLEASLEVKKMIC